MHAVAIVDDHMVVAEGFGRLIDGDPGFCTAGLYSSGEEFISSLRNGPPPQAVILDLWLPEKPGAEILRHLHTQFPDVKVLIVSAAARPEVVARCISEGADGFLGKSQTGEQLLVALRAIVDGQRYIDPSLFSETIEVLTSPTKGQSKIDGLSNREFTVMTSLARGSTIKDIARALNLNPKTVSTYRNRLLRKLGVTSNADLTAMCIKMGLLEFEAQS